MASEDKKDENVLTDEEDQEINVTISDNEYISRETLIQKIEKLELLMRRTDSRIKRHATALESMKKGKLADEEKARQALLKMGVNMLMGKAG